MYIWKVIMKNLIRVKCFSVDCCFRGVLWFKYRGGVFGSKNKNNNLKEKEKKKKERKKEGFSLGNKKRTSNCVVILYWLIYKFGLRGLKSLKFNPYNFKS